MRQGPNDAFGGRVRKIGCDNQECQRAKGEAEPTESERTRTSVKQSVGAATLLGARTNEVKARGTATVGTGKSTHLIHMLAKHATPITASSTTLGRVPAKLSTRVINTRSIFVFESAAAIVKPPMRSIIVGENITEKTQLKVHEYHLFSPSRKHTRRVAAAGLNRSPVSASRITRSHTSKAGTMVEVTKRGIAYKTSTRGPTRKRRE
jgi:hypothetical protein